MILNLFVQKPNKTVKIGKAVTRNTQFTAAWVKLELLIAQKLE
jgi:hypothetical protein